MSFLRRPWLQLGVLLAAFIWAQPVVAQESDDDDSAQESDDDDSAEDSEVVLGGGADDACSFAGSADKSSAVAMLALSLVLLRRKSS